MTAPIDEARLARIEEWASDHATRCHECDAVARVVIPRTTRTLCAACAPDVPGAVLPLVSAYATALDLVAEVRRLTAALATVTTERDALLAVCERFAGDEGVICNGYEDDSGCGSCGANANHSDADPANHAPDCARLAARVLAAKIRALPLDAPGGGS